MGERENTHQVLTNYGYQDMNLNQPTRAELRIGIAIEETWRFLSEIYEDLSHYHQTSLFNRRTFNSPIFHNRINRYLFKTDMQSFLRSNDVVFFEWASGLLAAASQLRKQSGIVTRLHRYEMYQWADKINWEAVDKVILVSKAKQWEFINRFPENKEKIVVIPVGIDLNKFKPATKSFKGDIGILCDLSPRKRVYELILAFYELSNKDDNFHLHIGGGYSKQHESYYLAILDLLDKLNLNNKVTLYGNVVDTPAWYQNIDIFISNGYSEGLQVAPMEAMASGCFCLSHNWHGADELLPGEYLYITNTELQNKILEYCDFSEEEKQLQKEKMRAHVFENFDIAKKKIEVRAVLEEVGSGFKG
jgi:glycosyltransferase involved in cell wall biosynthesis